MCFIHLHSQFEQFSFQNKTDVHKKVLPFIIICIPLQLFFHMVAIQYIFVDWTWISILVCLGYYNKNTINLWLINNRNFFLTVLEAQGSAIKVLAQ